MYCRHRDKFERGLTQSCRFQNTELAWRVFTLYMRTYATHPLNELSHQTLAKAFLAPRMRGIVRAQGRLLEAVARYEGEDEWQRKCDDMRIDVVSTKPHIRKPRVVNYITLSESKARKGSGIVPEKTTLLAGPLAALASLMLEGTGGKGGARGRVEGGRHEVSWMRRGTTLACGATTSSMGGRRKQVPMLGLPTSGSQDQWPVALDWAGREQVQENTPLQVSAFQIRQRGKTTDPSNTIAFQARRGDDDSGKPGKHG
ncbi:hypothetical protein DFH29DRAFT_880750 [Suillus ampliporus]|nr:hypothetical protein DFH29DRAFT_880750 [Suillus ampliporus]